MHQDQRIGLALGVLLVGACAAFFFRNETRTTHNAPRLQHAQELDDRIAERSTRPYLKGVEAVEAADRRRESPSEDHTTPQDNLQEPSYWSPLDPPDKIYPNETSSRFRKPRGRIVEETEIQELAPIAIPNESLLFSNQDHGTNGTVGKVDSTTDRTKSKLPDPVTSERTHVVQKGETLSSIAARTLGSPNRFHEIFDANVDQLKDPNDVKLGMTLRIPDQKTESASKPHGGRSRVLMETEAHLRGTVSGTPERYPALPNKGVRPLATNDDLDSKHNGEGVRPLYSAKPGYHSNEPDGRPDPLVDSVPRAFDSDLLPPRNDAAVPPRSEVQDAPSILIPPELGPNEMQPDSPLPPTPLEDSAPNKKFVPARRTPPPGRPIGPQVKNNGPRDFGGRKLSQASLESTSGKIAR